MSKLILALLLTCCFAAVAQSQTAKPAPKLYVTRYSIGPSTPTGSPSVKVDILQPGIELIRTTGGEYVNVTFLDEQLNEVKQPVAGVRITAFSKSGKGTVMVHSVSVSPTDEPTELKSLEGMIKPGKPVQVLFPKGVMEQTVTFQLEAFGDDDASVGIDIFYSAPGNFKQHTTEDYVNPPEESDSSGGGGGGGSGAGSYRDQCEAAPGHFGCDDRGPFSIYDQSGCEASPGSFECQSN